MNSNEIMMSVTDVTDIHIVSEAFAFSSRMNFIIQYERVPYYLVDIKSSINMI